MIALKEFNGKRELLVSEQLILEKCQSLKSTYLKKARCASKSWEYVRENGTIWYKFTSIPNRAPHFVIDHLGNEEDLIKIARFGNPEESKSNAKNKFLKQIELDIDYRDLHFYLYESGMDIKRETAEEYHSAYTWLKTINDYCKSNGWIRLGLRTKKEFFEIVIELLDAKKMKGLKISNPDALQRKINWYNEFTGDKRRFVISGLHSNNHNKKVTDEMERLFNSLFAGLGTKPTFEEVWYKYSRFVEGKYEIVNMETGEIYSPENFEEVSRSTIKAYLYKYENKIGNFSARSGDWTRFKLDYIPYYSFEKPKYANSLLSIDDRQPPFVTKGKKRTWYYMGMDLYSECYVAYVFGKHYEKNVEFLKNFYRKLLTNYHQWGLPMPGEIEMESSLNSTLKNSLLVPGVIAQNITIYQNAPNSKYIERAFGQLRYGLEKEDADFVCRPFARRESNQQGATAQELEYEDIVRKCNNFIEQWNNMPHSKFPEKTRLEVFLESAKSNPHVQEKIDWTKILPYLGINTLTSMKAGIVKYSNREYLIGNADGILTGDRLIERLRKINDGKVNVYYLNDDNGNHVASGIYTSDGRYIASLHPKPVFQKAKVEQTEADAILKETMAAYQNTIIGAIKESKSMIEEIQIDEKIAFVEPNYEEMVLMPTIDEDVEIMPNTTQKLSLYDRF